MDTQTISASHYFARRYGVRNYLTKLSKNIRNCWVFKHPAGWFLRTMEDASAVDLIGSGAVGSIAPIMLMLRWIKSLVGRFKTTVDPEKEERKTQQGDITAGGKATDFQQTTTRVCSHLHQWADAWWIHQSHQRCWCAHQSPKTKLVWAYVQKTQADWFHPIIMNGHIRRNKRNGSHSAEICAQRKVKKRAWKRKKWPTLWIDPNFRNCRCEHRWQCVPRKAGDSKFDQFKKGKNIERLDVFTVKTFWVKLSIILFFKSISLSTTKSNTLESH